MSVLFQPEVSLLLAVTAALVSIASGIISLEFLVLHHQFGESGLFSGRLVGLRPSGRRRFRWLEPLTRKGPIIAVLMLMFVASASTLAYAVTGILHGPSVLALALGLLLRNKRIGYGGDGSDQMSTIVILSLAACVVWPDPKGLVVAGALAFIGAQSVLSYLTAGVAKLFSKVWRSGNALTEITDTVTYGLPNLTFFQKHKRIAQLMCWSVVIMECAFPVVLFVPQPLAVAGLFLFALFHIGIARVMGLNTFVWAFVATYPAVLWLNMQFQGPWALWYQPVAAVFSEAVQIAATGVKPDWLVFHFTALLVAKVVAEDLPFLLGRQARPEPAVFLGFGLFLVVSWLLPAPMLLIAFLVRALVIGQRRFFATPNHPMLEWLLLAVLLTPNLAAPVLLALLQLIAVSVWVYAALQKLTNPGYRSGLFFYRFLAGRDQMIPSQRWVFPAFLPLPAAFGGDFGRLEALPFRFSRVLSWVVVVVELLVPLLALMFAGRLGAPLTFLMVAVVIGLSAREWSFMVTNCALAGVFLFRCDTWSLVWDTPHAMGWGLAFLLWPPLHMMLWRVAAFSPWRLFGWGMYSQLPPRALNPLASDGRVLEVAASSEIMLGTGRTLLDGFATCRIPGLAAWVQRWFAQHCCSEPVAAFELGALRRLGDQYATEYLLIPRSDQQPWRKVKRYLVKDEFTKAHYDREKAKLLKTLHASATTAAPRIAPAGCA